MPSKAFFPLCAAMLMGACTTPGTQQQQPSAASPVAAADSSSSADIAAATGNFGTSLYRQLEEESGNVLISPVSIMGALGVATAGARGETATAMQRALHLPGHDPAVHASLGALLRGMERSSDDATLSVANALWVQKEFEILPSFVRIASEDYDAQTESVDFIKAPDTATKAINDWVAKQTSNRITYLVSRRAITAATRLVITNAVYFLADWASPFHLRHTSDQPFYLADGKTVSTPLMFQNGHFRHAVMDDFQMIDLPYKDRNLSMTIVLPIKPAGLPALEARLDKELATWLHLIDATTPSSVDLFLPRIQMDAGYDLVPALKNMGMGIAFTNKADFKGIADTGLNISGVIHKTFLKMDEKGTEAAASTAVIVAMTAAPAMPTPVFRADRPFLLMIRDKTSGAILFLGRMSDPSEK